MAGQPSQEVAQVLKAIHNTIRAIPASAVALTSMDEDGFPSTRSLIPRAIDDDLSEIRLNTKKDTRKVREIQANRKVSMFWQDQRHRGGWVTIKGMATLAPCPGQEDKLDILIKPERCEVVSYNEYVMADKEGWVPAVMVRAGGVGAWHRLQ